MDLRQLGGTLICQKDAFLCAAAASRWASRSSASSVSLASAARASSCSARRRRHSVLRPRRRHAERREGSLPGRNSSSTPAVSSPAHERSRLRHPVCRQGQDGALRRRGLFLARVARPGTVWLQSLPFSRLASPRSAAPSAAGRRARRLGPRRLCRRQTCSAAMLARDDGGPDSASAPAILRQTWACSSIPFWRAVAYCPHPRVIALSVLPLVLMIAAAFWPGATTSGMRRFGAVRQTLDT